MSYSGPKASNTFPGLLPNAPYPELTNTMPPATTAPGPIIEAPLAGTPLTVVNSRLLSNCHSTSPVDVEYAVFMIAREGLENALRHARPSQVHVSLQGGPGDIELLIDDDGIGLEAGFDRRPGHLGLVGIRERARAIGATLLMDSHAGGGTMLILRWEA